MAKKKEAKNLPATTEDGAITTMPKTIGDLLTGKSYAAALRKAAPKHFDVERLIRITNTAVTKIPKLRECSPLSFWNCMVDLSALGLEPNGRDAHIIPYGKEATLIVDYKGLVLLVRRSGEVSDIHADIVCDNDAFEFNMGKIEEHRIDFRQPRGKMYAAYSYVKFRDGTESYQVMGRDEIDAIRERSKAKDSGPWKTDYNEMAKKTVFRRHSKWLPFSAEIHQAIEKDDRHLFPGIDSDTITGDDIKGMSNGTRMKLRPQDVQEAETEEPGKDLTAEEMAEILKSIPEDELIAAREACNIDMGVDISEDEDLLKLVYAAMKEIREGGGAA